MKVAHTQKFIPEDHCAASPKEDGACLEGKEQYFFIDIAFEPEDTCPKTSQKSHEAQS